MGGSRARATSAREAMVRAAPALRRQAAGGPPWQLEPVLTTRGRRAICPPPGLSLRVAAAEASEGQAGGGRRTRTSRRRLLRKRALVKLRSCAEHRHPGLQQAGHGHSDARPLGQLRRAEASREVFAIRHHVHVAEYDASAFGFRRDWTVRQVSNPLKEEKECTSAEGPVGSEAAEPVQAVHEEPKLAPKCGTEDLNLLG